MVHDSELHLHVGCCAYNNDSIWKTKTKYKCLYRKLSKDILHVTLTLVTIIIILVFNIVRRALCLSPSNCVNSAICDW